MSIEARALPGAGLQQIAKRRNLMFKSLVELFELIGLIPDLKKGGGFQRYQLSSCR